MAANFIPPIDLGQFKPSAAAISSWLYEVWKYLQENPIPSADDITGDAEQVAENYVAANVPPMIASAIAALSYAQFVDGTTLPIYRAANDEIDNPDLLEAWDEGCRFALVDDESVYVMIRDGNTVNLLQILTEQQAEGVVSVNGQTGVVTLAIPDDTDEITNRSGVSGETATAALNSLNTAINTVKNTEIITVTISAFSGSQIRVPASGTNAAISADHVVISSEITNPAYQTGDWVVNTYDGYLTISGAASSPTAVKLILGKAGTTI